MGWIKGKSCKKPRYKHVLKILLSRYGSNNVNSWGVTMHKLYLKTALPVSTDKLQKKRFRQRISAFFSSSFFHRMVDRQSVQTQSLDQLKTELQAWAVKHMDAICGGTVDGGEQSGMLKLMNILTSIADLNKKAEFTFKCESIPKKPDEFYNIVYLNKLQAFFVDKKTGSEKAVFDVRTYLLESGMWIGTIEFKNGYARHACSQGGPICTNRDHYNGFKLDVVFAEMEVAEFLAFFKPKKHA